MIAEKLREMGIGFSAPSGSIDEDRPTLVMIHGAGGCSQIWQNQTRLSKAPSSRLARSVNTLALDLPGHGQSDGSASPDMDGYAEWLSEVLSKVWDRPPFLMGHSMGGAIVQKVALSDPDRIRGIILVGTGPVLRVAPMFLKGLQTSFDTILDSLLGFAYAADADARLITEGIKLMKAAGKDVVYRDFLACNRFDMRNDLKHIGLPCLILCGSEDKLTPAPLSKKLNESIRNSRMEIIPQAGHMVMIEQFKPFNDRVLDFVLQVEAIGEEKTHEGSACDHRIYL